MPYEGQAFERCHRFCREPNPRPAARSETVSEIWKNYIEDRQEELPDISRLLHAWKALEPHFGSLAGRRVGKQECKRYVALRRSCGRADSTIRTELDYLQACLNLRYGTQNTRVWRPPPSKPRSRYLSREELIRILDAVAAPHVRLFITLAVATGARMKSILRLKWEQVDLASRLIRFAGSGRHITNKRETDVPMNARSFAALEEAKEIARSDYVIEWRGQPVRSIKKAIREAAHRSQVPCSPHVFRHTAGVWMAEADIPMQKIAQYLGHSSMRVTEQTYARYSPSFLRDAAQALEW